MSLANSKCCSWSSPTGTWVALQAKEENKRDHVHELLCTEKCRDIHLGYNPRPAMSQALPHALKKSHARMLGHANLTLESSKSCYRCHNPEITTNTSCHVALECSNVLSWDIHLVQIADCWHQSDLQDNCMALLFNAKLWRWPPSNTPNCPRLLGWFLPFHTQIQVRMFSMVWKNKTLQSKPQYVTKPSHQLSN